MQEVYCKCSFEKQNIRGLISLSLKDLEKQLLALSPGEKVQAIQLLAQSLGSSWQGIDKIPGVCGGEARIKDDFIRLHRHDNNHCGIIVCTNNRNWEQFATRIHEAVIAEESLNGKLIRVVRPTT